MFDLPIHPKIVHIPIALSLLLPLLASGVLLAWFRGALPKRAWWVVVGVQALLVLACFAAMSTGDSDSVIASRVVARGLIHAHEDAANFFLGATILTMVSAMAAALVRVERQSRALGIATVIVSLIAASLAFRVGHLGGDLVYQHGAANAFTTHAAE